MKRQDWSSGKPKEPLMSWGNIGDFVTNKTTGKTYKLRRKDEDGWMAQEEGGGFYKLDFSELATDFTDPKR